MILDEARFRVWLQSATFPEDIKDTIEYYLDEKVLFDEEFEKWVKETEDFEAKIKELEDKIENKDEKIKELEARLSLAQNEVETLKMTPEPVVKPGKYFAQGNTYPVKDLFKANGFRWDGDGKAWFLLDLGESTEKTVQKVRAEMKERGIVDAEIVFVEGK
jgi:CRISPR/Cas system CSM-associated protein Csm4 (group 5 of RAMP superfamily)